ncbi:alpha/beta hydrolase [Asticcacaulis sp. BYS171W]|uniref:Alpha/beta hydrolase n=1 Tax=Asticcacaulis aquaticus TaxID=2984212 RepID=A0ABT5HYT6_9CAUL|nr:alpha/beta hydrolase [Asticcacaulis aquaticus]MDC7685149.1 alpha/beta hydrolase [Asticcacaulis aquaticus]
MTTLDKRHLLGGLILGTGIGLVLSGCSTLTAFNNMTPKDSGSKRVAQDVAYGDHPRHRYDVYAPTGSKPVKGWPVLIFFFGGGWESGDKKDYAWMGRSLAALGYLVAVPNYRLYPEVVYPRFMEDAASAVRHIQREASTYGGDAKRLGVMGHSAGAYIAVTLALEESFLKFDPMASNPFRVCVGIAGPYDFYPFDVKAAIQTFGTYPRPQETQPLNHATQSTTKFLLQHSRADTVCGVHNSVNLDKALKKVGTSSTLQLYDGLSHQDCAAVYSVPFRGKAPLRADAAAFLKANL